MKTTSASRILSAAVLASVAIGCATPGTNPQSEAPSVLNVTVRHVESDDAWEIQYRLPRAGSVGWLCRSVRVSAVKLDRRFSGSCPTEARQGAGLSFERIGDAVSRRHAPNQDVLPKP